MGSFFIWYVIFFNWVIGILVIFVDCLLLIGWCVKVFFSSLDMGIEDEVCVVF